MIVQITPLLQFTEVSRIVLALQAPSAEQAHIALAVLMTGATAGLQVSDNLGGRPRWRCVNSCENAGGGRSIWCRIGGPHGGAQEVVLEAAHQITGTAVAAE